MADDAEGSEKSNPLREALRRLDSVLNFARKLFDESGEIPPGLVSDFSDARKELEKQFVLHFDKLEEKMQKQLRELLKGTKGFSGQQIGKHARKISQRTRSVLNQLMIHGEGPLSLTSELGAVRFNDNDPETLPDFSPSGGPPTSPPVAAGTGAHKSSSGMRRALVAVVLIGMLGGVALLVGIFVVPWSSPGPIDYNGNLSSSTNTGPPKDNTPIPADGDEPDKPFDAEAAGYFRPMRVQPARQTINPLQATPESLVPDELSALLIGYEELIAQVEPERLRLKPAETRVRVTEFADSAVAAESDWIKARQPFLRAFAEHLKEEQQLALYPAQTSANKVLISDVLFSQGGGQFSLMVTARVLAQACDAPLKLISPLGTARPLLSIELSDGVHTFNGESYGLRAGEQPRLLLTDMLVEMTVALRPTMNTGAGRLLCSAVLEHYTLSLSVEQARAALTDWDLAWLVVPGEEAEARDRLLYEVALGLQPAICESLMRPEVGGDANEALALYHLAEKAEDIENANKALLLLGERAERGAMLGEEPLAWVVAELLKEQKKEAEATAWYRRAMEDHPEDPRPVMRLVYRTAGDTRFELMREAYARGERSVSFLRMLGDTAAEEGENLMALAIMDEVLRAEFDPLDLERAALQCLALDRTAWALERLRDHSDVVETEPGLQRLELICELSENGLSDRATELAQKWRARGEADAFIESLLQRYGG